MRFLLFGLIATLLACSSRSPAPIYDRSSNPYRRAAESDTRVQRPSYYVVRKGDTLYSISWRYGLDYKTLAAWNGIGPPFTIFPNERLRLSEPRGRVERRDTPAASTRALPSRPASPPPSQPKPDDRASSPTIPSPAASSSKPRPTPQEPAPTPAQGAPATGPLQWQWPADGKILSSYSASDPGRKGIDIGGSVGDEVRAAADGEVVYSGSGLVGYGELIIIKHDERFLSAYGHNRARLVKEGERVRAGQKIAELGRTGTSEPMLHFEIRDNGQPVNPSSHLPRR
ncbi:MAG: peptidoglycan DD-metalloendopeptidase family protein [Xanthomonadales bacterium]|nr:peptidoglycan DD-metalloendopeptidase family protein [Xanthomonadales bacterium]